MTLGNCFMDTHSIGISHKGKMSLGTGIICFACNPSKICLKAVAYICLQWSENTLVWDENKYFKQKYPEIGNLEKGGIGECKGEERTFLLCSNMPMLENI